MSKKLRVGMIVREGGLLGPLSKIVGFDGEKYHLVSLEGQCEGWLTDEYLYPVRSFEQLTLF